MEVLTFKLENPTDTNNSEVVRAGIAEISSGRKKAHFLTFSGSYSRPELIEYLTRLGWKQEDGNTSDAHLLKRAFRAVADD